ncbi:MAG: glycosyltransferase family 4 protein [bacterium]
MKIAYIAAGAAGMYCGSCLRDNTLAAALQKLGHDVALIPTYTPLRTDEADVSIDRIFYGGINVYLEQKFALFRHTPWVFDKLLNNRALLNWVSRFSLSTNAQDLGALTTSMLAGEEGRQSKELARLVGWLKQTYQPDLVQLTTSMFAGFAREIKKALGVPVLCALQGDDIFLEGLIEPYKSQSLRLLRERAKEIDGFIASSRYYANFMADYLNLPAKKIHAVRLGLHLQGHGLQTSANGSDAFALGYLARICPEKGLHLLVEAFHLLAQELGRNHIRLKVAGYLGQRDRAYLASLVSKIDAWGLQDSFEFFGEVDRAQKIRFLQSLHVLSVPTTYKEPKGLYILEALANGIPVVQPRHGSFPELIESTGGGILVEPESPEAIARGVLSMLRDPALRHRFGQQGKAVVHRDFSDLKMAEETVEVYRQYVLEAHGERGVLSRDRGLKIEG